MKNGGLMEIVDSNLFLRFADYDLEIYQTLPTKVDAEMLEESSDVVGWISYAGNEGLELLIGVLYKASNVFS